MDFDSNENNEFSTFIGIITSSGKEFTLTEEIEAKFYSHCKKVIFHVIEPLLLVLCDRPLDDKARSSGGTKVLGEKLIPDHDFARFESSERQQHELEIATGSQSLLEELKGLDTDLRSILEAQKCLMTEERQVLDGRISEREVMCSLRGIRGAMVKLRNGIANSLEERRNDGIEPTDLSGSNFKKIECDIAAEIQEIDSLFEKLGDRSIAKNDDGNGKQIVIGQQSAEKREPSPDGDCSSFLSAQDFGFISGEKLENGRFDENCETVEDAFIDSSSKQCASMLDPTRKYVPIRASSSMLEFEYSSSSDDDDESSTSSKIQFDRTLSNTSSVVDIESHEESLPTEKCMQPETSKVKTENTEIPSNERTVSKEYLETSSRLSLLKRVDSRYIKEAREVLLDSLRGQEVESEKLIANFSQTGLELMKFAYKNPLEEVAEALLSGPFKDIEIEDIYDCKPGFAAKSGLTEEKIDSKSKNNLTNSEKTNFDPTISSCMSSHRLSLVAGESNDELKIVELLSSENENKKSDCEGLKIKAEDLAERKMAHMLKIVKMLRSIIRTLKKEGLKTAVEFSARDKQHRSVEFSGEHFLRQNFDSSKDKTRTLLDHLLEELFKKILLKKFEQKIQAESRISSDESLNQLLFDLNQSDNTTPRSFSDDAFEDFKSNTPSGTNKQCMDEPIDRTPQDAVGSEKVVVEEKSPETPGPSGRENVLKNSKTLDAEENEVNNSNNQVCELQISDICSLVKTERPIFPQNSGKIEVNEFTGNLSCLPDLIKKVSVELLRKSDERLVEESSKLAKEKETPEAKLDDQSKETKNSAQLDFPGTQNEKSGQSSMRSNATELVEEEVDFNEQIRYLGQQIVDIEKYLSDFESEEKSAGATENPTAGTSEDLNPKLTAPGKHCLLSPEAPPEKAPDNFRSENAAVFSEDKILKITQMTDESNTSIKISDQNLLKECEFLSSVGSSDFSEDFSSSRSENFDYNSFTTADNFVPSSELPVKDVFYANLVMPCNTTTLVLSPNIQDESKFCFSDEAPKITESESAQHVVFTRDALSKLIRQEADALEVDVPSIISILKGGNSKDVKVRISEDSNFDVKLSKSDFDSLVTAVKISKPDLVEELTPNCYPNSADMLIQKANVKSSKMSSHIGPSNRVKTETPDQEVTKILLGKGSLVKILNSIISKAKSVESKESKGIVMKLSENSLDGVNISKAVKVSSSKVALSKILHNLIGFPSKDKNGISKSQTSMNVSRKISTTFDYSLSFGNLRSTAKTPEHLHANITEAASKSSVDSNAQSETEDKETQSTPRFKFGFAASSGMVNQRARVEEYGKSRMFPANSYSGVRTMKSVPNQNLAKPPEAINDVLSASSLSNFGESLHSLKHKNEKSSASSSESSIADRLFSASSSSLPGNETTASVLALEPTKITRKKTTSTRKSAESEKIKYASESFNKNYKSSLGANAAKPDLPEKSMDPQRAAFKLIQSCEQILNCKRRSDEIRSRSFNKVNNPEGKSLVTVLKTVDEKFVDKISSYGPAAFGKSDDSRPVNDANVYNADSSELEEKNTRYDLIAEAAETLENDADARLKFLGLKNDQGLTKDKMKDGFQDPKAQEINDSFDVDLKSGNSSDTSYDTAQSEVYYDLPTVESDLAYYLEIERKFTLSCLEIERSINESRAREAALLEMKISRTMLGGKKHDHERKMDLTSSFVKKKLPLKGKEKINKKDYILKKNNHDRRETCEYLGGFQKQDMIKPNRPIERSNIHEKSDEIRTKMPIKNINKNQIENWERKQTLGMYGTEETTEEKTSAEKFETFSVHEFCRKKKSIKKQNCNIKNDFEPRVSKHLKSSHLGGEDMTEKNRCHCDPVQKPDKSCKQNACKKHRSKQKHDACWQENQGSETQNESVTERDALRECLSCKRMKGVKIRDPKMNSKPNGTSKDQSTLERQLNLINDSLRLGARMHSQFHDNQNLSKYAPKPSRFECTNPVRTGLQESLKNQHDVNFRSRFTRNHNRSERTDDSVDSTFESSSQSEVSHRTLRSDGEKVSIGSPALNANTLMDFFERVYGVYDHIRQCHSCKALMSQIIEEVITDLAAMKRSRT